MNLHIPVFRFVWKILPVWPVCLFLHQHSFVQWRNRNLYLGLAHLFGILSGQDCIQTRESKMELNPMGVSEKPSCNLGNPREGEVTVLG